MLYLKPTPFCELGVVVDVEVDLVLDEFQSSTQNEKSLRSRMGCLDHVPNVSYNFLICIGVVSFNFTN